MDTSGDDGGPTSPSSSGRVDLSVSAPAASSAPSSAMNGASSLVNGLEDSENDSDGGDRKRRRLRRGDARPNPTTSTDNVNENETDDVSEFVVDDMEQEEDEREDDYGEQAEELDEEIIDELDIQERERQYFSEDDLDDDIDGEDLGENAEMDYRKMETLDRYDTTMLDSRQYDDMDIDTRRAVEEELNRRDARQGRIAQAFLEDQEMEHDDAHRRRFQRRVEGDEGFGEMKGTLDDDEELINLEHFDVPLREWIATETPRNEIKRRFRNFLKTFSDGKGKIVYYEKIVQMAQRNEQSLEIEIGDVIHSMSMVAAWIVEAPKDMLAILDEVAQEVVLSLFPYYSTIHQQIYVRILDLPGTERLRDLRTAHLNFLIKVTGVVTRRTSVFPQLQLIKLNCPGCGAVLGPFTQQSQKEVKLNACPECQFRGHFPVNSEQTVYRNFQKITLQESPGSVPPGRVPRSKDVVLVGDLIDKARPGDEIAVTGIYTNTPDPTLNLRDGFPVFRTVIEANHVERRADVLGSQLLTADDKKHILRLAKQPDIAQRIINSIAPSIYGHQQVKTALALALFGGKPKFIKNSRVRGDLNVLLVGDPANSSSDQVNGDFGNSCDVIGIGIWGVGMVIEYAADSSKSAFHANPKNKKKLLRSGR
ncbi:dna replication licensing factor [Plasmopara halstedii]|uniref:DNA replication licensing factor MCM2 n=1 Tax=Plasmopara halstedii TaxID=4781 RepID=A0A0P1AX87_PLAHL|nr:dna replication licensing factor [Plasmopara halstedii]CEG46124.1 dna replication licensing factor [Plasmopara halstedii]|eukprot:XP_024582493.1 dna replication licensing factor [Plasmopara halstedii]